MHKRLRSQIFNRWHKLIPLYKDMVNKLSKHLRVSADDEDDEFESIDDTDDRPQEIDPRWNELKKILDNN